jgi:hypothetical protein
MLITPEVLRARPGLIPGAVCSTLFFLYIYVKRHLPEGERSFPGLLCTEEAIKSNLRKDHTR